MLIWLLEQFDLLQTIVHSSAGGDAHVSLTARIALASVTSFVMALLLGPPSIRWLKKRFRERVDSASARLNELHAAKNDTPTMGGLFIVSAILISTLLWGDLGSRYVQLAILTACSFGALGTADDWIKLSTSRNGLRIKQKLAIQVAAAALICLLLYFHHLDVPQGLTLVSPVGNLSLSLGAGFALWSLLVLVGSSNAVNLTDGLDGLASGCMVFAGLAFTALSYLSGHKVLADYLAIPYIAGSGELAVVMGATVGAMLGFLWFNCYPAQVFMGDTGSLPVGALLGLCALVTRQEILLVLVGGIFVLETLSVIFQVGWFKLTGLRLIACSPLHNHFLFKGQHEIKIVVRFWIGSALLAIVAVASLRIG